MSLRVLCQVVQIHPDRGSLCPKESVLCVLTFTSADYPTFYQLDLICQVLQIRLMHYADQYSLIRNVIFFPTSHFQVMQEATMVRYHHDLQSWEEEEKSQQDEFTITETSLTDIPAILTDKVQFKCLDFLNLQMFIFYFFTFVIVM